MAHVKAAIQISTGTTVATVNPIRPGWAAVYEGYPLVDRGTARENDQPGHDVFVSVFGKDYDTKIFTNACATRVSIALNKANYTVRKDFIIRQGDLHGKGIITSAINLKKWLAEPSRFGEPDVKIVSPSSLNDVKVAIGQKKGIYILESNNYKWASGHATLWYDEHAIGNHDYYDHAKEIFFWELK
jgi:hypothetical protein